MLKLITSALLAKILIFSVFSANAEIWTTKEKRILSGFQLSKLDTNDNSASNAFAYNKQAAVLGKQFFFDKRFSQNNALSCASCHQPDNAFTDGLSRAKGIHKTGRNTQTLLGAAYQHWYYWDGRKDSLWSQALVPFEAADEMASSRVQVLRIIGKDKAYRQQYEAIFGQFPQRIFNPSIASNAGPWGNTETRNNWYQIPKHLQTIINQSYANIGKAIAAYERTIALPITQFDRYLDVLFTKGESKANGLISTQSLAGLKLFINQSKTHCMRCHNGPLFSNGEFHNIGTGNLEGSHLDFGRYFGIQAVVQDAFNCLGPFSDAKPASCTSLRFLPKQIHNDMQGAYKTPTLRYLNKTKPYLHDGRFNTLDQVMGHYQSIENSTSELPAMTLSKSEIQDIIAFIHLLNAP